MAARGLKTGEHVIEREAEEDWRKRRVRDSPFSRVVSVVSYRVLPVNIAYIIVIVDVVVCTRATLISNWYHRANQYCVRTWLPVSVMTRRNFETVLFSKRRESLEWELELVKVFKCLMWNGNNFCIKLFYIISWKFSKKSFRTLWNPSSRYYMHMEIYLKLLVQRSYVKLSIYSFHWWSFSINWLDNVQIRRLKRNYVVQFTERKRSEDCPRVI